MFVWSRVRLLEWAVVTGHITQKCEVMAATLPWLLWGGSAPLLLIVACSAQLLDFLILHGSRWTWSDSLFLAPWVRVHGSCTMGARHCLLTWCVHQANLLQWRWLYLPLISSRWRLLMAALPSNWDWGFALLSSPVDCCVCTHRPDCFNFTVQRNVNWMCLFASLGCGLH